MQNADPGQTWRGSCSEGAGEGGRGGGGSGAAQEKNASNRSRGVPPPRSALRDLDGDQTNGETAFDDDARNRQPRLERAVPAPPPGRLEMANIPHWVTISRNWRFIDSCLGFFFHWNRAPCRASPEGGSVSTGNYVRLFAPTVRPALFSPYLAKEPEKKTVWKEGVKGRKPSCAGV